MNEELQKQLAEMLKALMNVASDGATWAKGEIPALVQEKIAFGRASETAWLVIPLLAVTCAGAMLPRLWRSRQAAHAEYEAMIRDSKRSFDRHLDSADDAATFRFMAVLAVVVTGSFIALMQLDPVLKVWLAPRLYIIDWLRSLPR